MNVWGEQKQEAFSDMVWEYISENLEEIVLEYEDRIREILAEIDSERMGDDDNENYNC